MERAEETIGRLRAERDGLRGRITELERGKRLFEAALSQMPCGVIVTEVSLDRHILCNDAVARIFRQPSPEQPHDLSGFRPNGCPYRPEEWPIARSVLEGEVILGEEIRIQRGDGTRGWIRVCSSPIRDQEGRILYGIAILEDITPQKEAEDALRESEERLTAFIDYSPTLAWMKDEEGRWVYINRTFESRFGAHLGDWLGKTDFDFWPREMAEQFRRNDLEVLATDRPLEIIEEVCDTDGKSFLWLVCKFPFRDREGRRYVGGVGVDVTARVLAEREAQLRAKQLDEANNELKAFAYSVSHDLRAPLRTIDGFSRVLMQEYASKLDDQGKQYLQLMRDDAQRMARLIDALLKLSKLLMAEMRLERVDLSQLALDIVKELQGEQPERQVEVVITHDVMAKGDPALLRVLLENLLRNAWKFTSKGERARIEFGMTRQGGEDVYFMGDNGVGFDQAHADKLFRPFQRLHREEDFPGTGIGLATVQRIVHRHGGRVWAEGAVGRGATVFFTLL